MNMVSSQYANNRHQSMPNLPAANQMHHPWLVVSTEWDGQAIWCKPNHGSEWSMTYIHDSPSGIMFHWENNESP